MSLCMQQLKGSSTTSRRTYPTRTPSSQAFAQLELFNSMHAAVLSKTTMQHILQLHPPRPRRTCVKRGTYKGEGYHDVTAILRQDHYLTRGPGQLFNPESDLWDLRQAVNEIAESGLDRQGRRDGAQEPEYAQAYMQETEWRAAGL